MRVKIETYVHWLNLSDLQRDSLEAEFLPHAGNTSASASADANAEQFLDPGAKVAIQALTGLHELLGLQPVDHETRRHHPPYRRSSTNPSAAARLVAYMERNSLTQVEFAEKAKINEKTVSRILSSHAASPRTWAEVAHAMGITPNELFQQTGQ
jgi:hypothetical protein